MYVYNYFDLNAKELKRSLSYLQLLTLIKDSVKYRHERTLTFCGHKTLSIQSNSKISQ